MTVKSYNRLSSGALIGMLLVIATAAFTWAADPIEVPYSQNSAEADLVDQVGDAPLVQRALSLLPPMNPAGCHCVVMLPAPKTLKATKAVGHLEISGRSVSWLFQGTDNVEVRVNAPDGDIFAASPVTEWQLGEWAVRGTFLYLQDVTGGKPLVRENTVAVAVVK